VKGDFRHAVNFDTTYTFGIAKLNAFADVEFIRTESLFYLPGSYRWASTRRDINYDFGTKADFELIKGLLSFSTTYRYERADGTNEFSKSVAPVPTDVPYLDDYIKHSADAKLSYNMSKALKVDVGYLYENLKYSDTAYAQYTIGGNNFTGAYANPNYDASVVYTKLTYKF
ncbi:MAG: MtrB/PioB family outer membrane beta-barrel protein, partial [Geobacteraceae bacterium]|nr:MtrB/PioB family outer membrane beta-barrel protein [Geobacteraceae bacterium]